MNEVTKLYKNAGVEKITITYYCNIRENEDCPHENDNVLCKECVWGKPILKYPPFTAEKQLELIKWCIDNYRGEIFDTIETEWFAEQLSAYINNLWRDLTKEDKQQIKEVLK